VVELSISRRPYVIPSYSLTGDLLAYLKCGLQYRYQNRGALPPSTPVQLWFGEFIHALLEEAYLRWSQGLAPVAFPWDWQEHVRPIELSVNRRLRAGGLFASGDQLCPFDGESSACRCSDPSRQRHKLLASQRAEAAINTWAPHLFPLISEAEVPLQSIRQMPIDDDALRRADYYEVTGVVDVIGSVSLYEAPSGNLLVHYLEQDPSTSLLVTEASAEQYEVIVDYKGMRRPPTTSPLWNHVAWQVQTYAWLRAQQTGSWPVLAAILIFINELIPSQQDIQELRDDVRSGATDLMPTGLDAVSIEGWRRGQLPPRLSTRYREERSIRLISVDPESVRESLQRFDSVVTDLELSVQREMTGQGVVGSWRERPSGERYAAPERRTCTACDFKHHCPLAPQVREGGPPAAP
jgi:hypothetical protein